MLTLARLESLLNAFPRLSIGLIGDLFLDRYLEIDPQLRELSIETGLEAYQVTRVRNSPGALGTVINNLAALGVGRLTPVTVLGDDGQAYDLIQELQKLLVDSSKIVQDRSRQTPTYTKPMQQDASGSWRELNRLDLRNRAPLSRETEDAVIAHATATFHETDGLIVLDQVNEEGWGVVTPRVREHLCALSAASPEKLMFVDSRAHIASFHRGVLKPNRRECLLAAGMPKDAAQQADMKAVREAAAQFAVRTGQPLFCTLGELGILTVLPTGESELSPSVPVEGPLDIVGAGDSATSGIVASWLAGASPFEAADVANLVASITVQQLGTTGTATPSQVLARFREARQIA